MQLLFAVLLLVALVCAWGSTCDEFGTSQEKCLAATEGGEKCAYCTSGAVGSECMKETDAKGLPSSVFKCTYASSIAASSRSHRDTPNFVTLFVTLFNTCNLLLRRFCCLQTNTFLMSQVNLRSYGDNQHGRLLWCRSSSVCCRAQE